MMRTLVLWAVALGALGAFWVRPARAEDLPDVKSRSAVVLDAETGAEIFGKDADEIRPIASTTKIFVAMAVRKKGLELENWTEITKADARSAVGGARTRLDVGQKFRNKDLLRAMLIASDNRAPTALGRGAGMDPDELVAAMNKVAKELHLKRTKFTDPSGLHGNVSTAREMAIALRAALEDDVLRGIMGEDFAEVVSKDHYAKIGYGSTNQVLVARKYDVIGGKTGYTKPAGYCFVTAARFDKREVVMAFLGADGKATRFGDFNRVAAWIDRGAPGSKISTKRPKRSAPKLDVETRGRVATP
jgi:serine-type D-Ala-D-Ala endopeptidase (penicillin-binding protein 7)